MTVPELKMIVYPGLGYRTRRGKWCLRLSGTILDNASEVSIRNRWLVRMLAKAMKAAPGELDSDVFRARIRPFVARVAPDLQVVCHLGGKSYRMKKSSRRSGGFRGKILLDKRAVDGLIDRGIWQGNLLPVQLEVEGLPPQETAVYVLPNTGVSIISDIDDTIKVSEIGDRRELLANTFLREYRTVGGMSETYRRWAQMGIDFHYVSSSPWQLYPALADFLRKSNFPPGTVHLRYFRVRDEVVRRRTKTRRRKSRTIRRLIKAYPNRRFVLIGDSGERDPEIYARLGAKYPDQVLAVFIRDLASRPLTDLRYRQLLDDFSDCRVFSDAADLERISQNLW